MRGKGGRSEEGLPEAGEKKRRKGSLRWARGKWHSYLNIRGGRAAEEGRRWQWRQTTAGGTREEGGNVE